MFASAHPVGGVDYPRTFRELEGWFPDESSCLAYLARLRWPDGFVCPSCRATKAWQLSRGLWRCASCRRETSLTAGTIFAATKLPLKTWFAAVWYVTNQKLGVSALGLQHALGLGSYETAWAMLHKLRRAMVRPSRDRLAGELEVDESYIGGVAPGKPGRGAEKKTAVAIAVEKRGRGMGRIRLARITDTSTDSLLPFIEDAIDAGSVLYTDGHKGYRPLAARRLPARADQHLDDRRPRPRRHAPRPPRLLAAQALAARYPPRAPSARSNSTTTWTSSPFASTAAALATAASSSTDSSSRPYSSSMSRSLRSSAAARCNSSNKGERSG